MPEETTEEYATDHLSELTGILERIQQYQQSHANLLADNPTVDAYWHAGQQIVSAALMIKSAVDMVRQGKTQ